MNSPGNLKIRVKSGLFLPKVILRGYIKRSFGEHHENQPTLRQSCCCQQQIAAPLAAKSGPVTGTPAKTGPAKSAQPAGVAVTVSALARSLEAASTGETGRCRYGQGQRHANGYCSGNLRQSRVIVDKLLANAQEMLPAQPGLSALGKLMTGVGRRDGER